MTNTEFTKLLAKIFVKINKNEDTEELIDLVLKLNKTSIDGCDFYNFMETVSKRNYNEAFETFLAYLSDEVYSKEYKEKFIWLATLETTLAKGSDDECRALIKKILKENSLSRLDTISPYYKTEIVSLCLRVGDFEALEEISNL